jgi:hypothetical protein
MSTLKRLTIAALPLLLLVIETAPRLIAEPQG